VARDRRLPEVGAGQAVVAGAGSIGAGSIGIDDGSAREHRDGMTRTLPPDPAGRAGPAERAGEGAVDDAAAAAATLATLFRAIYLTYHRRDGPRSNLTGASRAVLGHLAHTGPLTIGEAALHLDRAQSVVSEIVDGLQRRGLLMRDRDPADRRRTLVWLTPAGVEALRRDAEVLSEEALASAIARMTHADRTALLTGAAALLDAAPPTGEERP
jgi:DNA-binding MarR family transcriptional regulator